MKTIFGKPKDTSVYERGRTPRGLGGSRGEMGWNMIFDLTFSGLCAFVLSPCDQNTTKVSAVFPGGPFKFSDKNKDNYPAHHPILTVDVADVDPSSTALPMAVVAEPKGSMFAVFEISGEIQLKIDGAVKGVRLTDNFKNRVTMLSKVTKKPNIGNLRDNLLNKKPNKYSRAHLTLPFDQNGAPLDALSSGTYKFANGLLLDTADKARVAWEKLADRVVFKDYKGKTIVLKDPPAPKGDRKIEAVLSSHAHHIDHPTDDLMHFPSYFFLSRNLKKLTAADRTIPRFKGGILAESKLVACAICQGCQG